MTLREAFDKLIVAERPDIILINRKRFKQFLIELSKIDESFKDVRLKYRNVFIQSNPTLSDNEVRSSKNPKIIV